MFLDCFELTELKSNGSHAISVLISDVLRLKCHQRTHLTFWQWAMARTDDELN
jgi:hypothetical protein